MTRLFVEKVADNDAEPSAPDELFLAADATEYEGGHDFAGSTRVIVSQLKYSTRHPDKAWTPARLCESRTSGGPSVASRFGELFRGYLKIATRTEILGRLKIRLVSNQPVSDKLLDNIREVQAALSASASPTTKQKLLQGVSTDARDLIERVFKEASLSVKDFLPFLRTLDFTECGSASLEVQEDLLFRDLLPSFPGTVRMPLLELCDLVREESLPNRAGSPGISRSDVLMRLRSSDDELFPAPQMLNRVASFIRTDDAEQVAKALTASNRHVVAHGDAGIGKSTTVAAVADLLPPGSELIVYDCFAGGDYLNPSHRRHASERAIVQLINELAARTKTPPLIGRPQLVADLYRELEKRLELASAFVRRRGGHLVIVIDAADNSVYAARKLREECFVAQLWGIKVPDGACLAMTCRTHRTEEIEAPASALRVELEGFTELNTVEHVRGTLPNVSDLAAKNFHARTMGNPRLQRYLLDESVKAGLDEPLQKHSSLRAYYTDLFESASRQSADPDAAESVITAFVAMTPPVPVCELAKSLGIREEDAKHVLRGLAPGLQFSGSEVRSLDEDFDTFIRERPTQDALEDVHARISGYLQSVAEKDEYAAIQLSRHLEAGGRGPELLELALYGGPPKAVDDEARRNEVWRDRIAAALRVSTSGTDRLDAVKLMLVAAEASRENAAIEEVVRQNPDLALRFSTPGDGGKYFQGAIDVSKKGPWCFRTAARASRTEGGDAEALRRLEEGLAWVRERSRLDENARYSWDLSAGDVAHAIEAVFRIHGAAAARDWLLRWRPRKFVIEVVHELARLAARLVPYDELAEILSQLNEARWVEATFTGALLEAGQPVPASKILELFDELCANPAKDEFWQGARTHLTAIVEQAVKAGVARDKVLRFLGRIDYTLGDGHGPMTTGAAPWSGAVREVALHAALVGHDLSVNDLMPKRFEMPEKGEDYYRSEREWFLKGTEATLPLVKQRVAMLLGSDNTGSLLEIVRCRLKVPEVDSGYAYSRSGTVFYPWAIAALRFLEEAGRDASEASTEIFRAAVQRLPNDWDEFALDASLRMIHTNSALLAAQWLAKSFDSDPFSKRNAHERSERLLKGARIVADYDPDAARSYYRRAIETLKGINNDTALLLSAIANVAFQARTALSQEDRAAICARLVRLLWGHVPHVSESRILPFDQILETVTHLDVSAGAALVATLDEEREYFIHDGVRLFVEQTLKDGTVTAEESLSLLPLAGKQCDRTPFYLGALERLESEGFDSRSRLRAVLTDALAWCAKDCPLARRLSSAKELLGWASEHSETSSAAFQELEGIADWLSGRDPSLLRVDKESGYNLSEYRKERDEEAKALEAEWATIHLEDLVPHIVRLYRVDHDPQRLSTFLGRVRGRLRPSERIPYLDVLADAAEADLVARPLVQEALNAYHSWSQFDSVEKWSSLGLARLLHRHLPELTYGREEDRLLGDLLSAIEASGADPILTVLRALAAQIQSLRVTRLYVVYAYVAGKLPAADSAKLLDWVLDRTEGTLDLVDSPLEIVPSLSSTSALARLLYVRMGNPSKESRWLALHAGRRLLSSGRGQEAIREWLSKADSVLTSGFIVHRLRFYPFAAKQWMLMTLGVAAETDGFDLRAHLDDLEAIALSEEFPHVVIRELARNLTLELFNTVTVSQERRLTIECANRPRACHIERVSSWERDRGWDRRAEGRRFSFDELDTTPYWFPRVSRLFGYPVPDVETTVEAFIIDDWGFRDEEVRREMKSYWHTLSNWEERHNGQGTYPAVEDLQTYLEYNGMLCAAGRYADDPTTPIHVSPAGGQDEKTCEGVTCELNSDEVLSDEDWENFLRSHLPARGLQPLSDLRRPTPLLEPYWRVEKPDKNWHQARPLNEYEELLGLNEGGPPRVIVIGADSETHGHGGEETWRVVSAMVSPMLARSLMLAIDRSNAYSFGLPIRDLNGQNFSLDNGEFRLVPLLEHPDIEEGIDKFDPFVADYYGGRWGLTSEVASYLGIARDTRSVWRDGSGSVVAQENWWADGEREKRDEDWWQIGSKGRRLTVDRAALLGYLSEVQMDLIIEVTLSRNVARNRRAEGESYRIGQTRIFILRRDGCLVSVARDRQPGQDDCS